MSAYPIKGFNPHTFIDWEGKIACVIYLPGCNFRCPFCHSSSLVNEPQNLMTVPFERIEHFLNEKQGWIDAVVIQGGEPTLYSQLPQLLAELKSKGMKTKVDTNGTNPRQLRDMITAGVIDYIAMDLKAPLDDRRYHEAAGVPVALDAIRASIDVLLEERVDYEFRTTVVPTLLAEQDILAVARSIQGARRYVLQQFSPKDTLDKRYALIQPLSDEILKRYALLAKEYVKDAYVRGA